METTESTADVSSRLDIISDLEAFHEEFILLVRDGQRVMRDALDPICSAHGLSQQQMLVLMMVSVSPGSHMSKVSDELGILRTNFTQIVRKLEDRGLVRRTQDERDRRSFSLDLTEGGRSLLLRMRDEFARRNALAVDRLSPQVRDDLKRGLAAMREVIGAMEASGHRVSDCAQER